MQDEKTIKVAGIHLASLNSTKTTLVIMTGRLGDGNLKIVQILDRMGPMHRLFSDDRLFETIRRESLQQVMIASPLTVPPCVACTRGSCPGVIACEDIAVAYMQKLGATAVDRRRKRPINPQTQRVWDIKEWLIWHPTLQEPSFSANKAPLAIRAMTLQRRLNSLAPPLQLLETSVPHALHSLVDQFALDRKIAEQYRNFTHGLSRRQEFLSALVEQKRLDVSNLEEAASCHENFSATMAALVAGFLLQGNCSKPPNEFFREQGWVYLPELACSWPRKVAVD